MDLYRYFHPQYNPRLRTVAMRLLEINELEQAARELRNAVDRASVRTEVAPVGQIRAKHFSEICIALDYVIESLATLGEAHPGDDNTTLRLLFEERRNAPGWENWASLLRQRLELLENSPDSDGDKV